MRDWYVLSGGVDRVESVSSRIVLRGSVDYLSMRERSVLPRWLDDERKVYCGVLLPEYDRDN